MKISQENAHVTSQRNYRLQQDAQTKLKLDHLVTSHETGDEFCVNSKGGSPLLLYLESVRTMDTVGVAKVVFHYDVEKLSHDVMADPMEGKC